MTSGNSSSFHRIRSIQVKGGFLGDLRADFADHLNCLIGGRGTGKTTVLEVLRWVLDKMPADNSQSRDLKKLIQANLGSAQAEVEISTSKGMNYRIRRSADADPIVMTDGGEAIDIDIGRGSIFTADVYSQNEIETIANEPFFQLKLIDKFVAERLREIAEQMANCDRALHANAAEIIKLREAITTLKEKGALLPEVTEKLKAYVVEEGDDDSRALQQASKAKALRHQEVRALDRLKEHVAGVTDALRDAISDSSAVVDQLIDKAILEGPNAQSFRDLRDAIQAKVRDAQSKVDDAALLLDEGGGQIQRAAADISALHVKQEKSYQDLLETQEKEKEKAGERDRLLQRQAELQESSTELDERLARLRDVEGERATLLRRLSDMRDARFDHRTKVAEMLTGALSPTIRVHIEQYGNTDPYRDLLLESMKGSGFKYGSVVDRVVERIPPQEFVAIVQRGDVDTLADQLEIDADRANRLLLHLKDKEAIFDIERVDLHDRPTIELKDGPDYKDSSALSTGQKCTTILPILLLESASPLLIDQPEDNLDNAFIYDTVVQSIRGVRGKRQLIFATHNPNIPVLGDAERVLVLQSSGRRARLKAVGNVDEVKDEVETILEGGREAFQRRQRRYGY